MGRGRGSFRLAASLEENVKFGLVATPEPLKPAVEERASKLAQFNPAALSVLYTLPRLHPTALAISVAPIPCLRSDTMRARSNVTGRLCKSPSPLRPRCQRVADHGRSQAPSRRPSPAQSGPSGP